jgi:nitroreductase
MHVVTDLGILDAIASSVISAEGRESFVPADPLTGEARSVYPTTVVESAEVLKVVPVGIFIENLGVFSRSRREVAESPREYRENVVLGFGLEILGIGAAIENMWIAAIDLGLAGVFMGDILIAEDFIKETLGFSGDLIGVLAIGFSATGQRTTKPVLEGRVVYW